MMESAFEYFEGIRRKCERVEALQFQIGECADGLRASCIEGAGGTGGASDPTERRALSLVERDRELSDELDQLSYDVGEALALIDGVGDILGARYAGVLEARYIDGLEWDEIVALTGKTRATVFRWHRVALDLIDGLGRAHVLDGRGIAEI